MYFDFLLDNQDNLIESFQICLENSEIVTDSRGGTPEFVKMPVYFATDRNYKNTKDVYEQFGSKRSKLK